MVQKTGGRVIEEQTTTQTNNCDASNKAKETNQKCNQSWSKIKTTIRTVLMLCGSLRPALYKNESKMFLAKLLSSATLARINVFHEHLNPGNALRCQTLDIKSATPQLLSLKGYQPDLFNLLGARRKQVNHPQNHYPKHTWQHLAQYFTACLLTWRWLRWTLAECFNSLQNFRNWRSLEIGWNCLRWTLELQTGGLKIVYGVKKKKTSLIKASSTTNRQKISHLRTFGNFLANLQRSMSYSVEQASISARTESTKAFLRGHMSNGRRQLASKRGNVQKRFQTRRVRCFKIRFASKKMLGSYKATKLASAPATMTNASSSPRAGKQRSKPATALRFHRRRATASGEKLRTQRKTIHDEANKIIARKENPHVCSFFLTFFNIACFFFARAFNEHRRLTRERIKKQQ